MIHHRLGCSTISFRHLPLSAALVTIRDLGFGEIDLGALPGVCDHVPFVLDAAAVSTVAATTTASGLRVRSINGDVGDLNVPIDAAAREAADRHLDMLLELAVATGAQALVLPCGALDHTPVDALPADLDLVADRLTAAADRAAACGVELWVETLHLHRLCHDIERAAALTDRLPAAIGVVMDFSHIVASGADPVDFVARFAERITHVHLRDAVRGDINRSLGNGEADFAAGLAALADADYAGRFSLELETRDVTNDERPTATARAADLVTALL